MKHGIRPRLTLAAALAAAVLVSAQNPPPGQPIFRGGANVVLVDLFATRDGRLVDDLKASEVEVLEDGVTQTIDSFERVVVRPPVSQELRAEPNSVPESRQMAADPRARIFVIFLDTYHAGFGNAARMRAPLQQFIDRVVGQDDLIALMTPEMAASDVTLGRRTTVISALLNDNTWGRRGRLADNDPIENMYEACYTLDDPKIAAEMKARRREKLAFDALQDLVTHLGGLRDERKAVLAVSEGWIQYGPNLALARQLKSDEGRLPQPPGIVGRGASSASDRSGPGGTDRQQCQADRMALANMDHTLRLQEIGERANRVNVTFYPVGAQGLAVFDSDIGPEPPPPLAVDAANLRTRQNGLRLLADVTDGVSIVNTNNVTPLLRRVVDDLSAYYLLTYSSTNSKLDGKFRSINVRLARPGVQTRFRRGYRALTPKEVPTTITGAGAAPAMPPAESAVLAALNAMAFNPRAELRLRASAWTRPVADPTGRGAFWLVGTLDDVTRRDPAWTGGGTAEVAVRAGDGRVVFSKSVPFTSLAGFALEVPEGGALAPGDYTVRVRARGASAGSIEEMARVAIPAEAPVLGEAVVSRRRPATGPAFIKTADQRASRTDRLRLEFATAAVGDATATLLDRAGKPLAVPLQVGAREEGGVRWITIEGAIAPLAPGDYAVEVKLGEATRTTAFRVVP